MTRIERRITAAAVFLFIASPVPISADPPKALPRCAVLEAWMLHENCLAHGVRDCAAPYH